MSQRIAIIGAGPAGLVAAKSCLEYGLQPVIFEKSSRLGGVWSRLAWQGMHTNLSKWSCMFSDFPWPDDMQDFPLQSDVEQYLHRYADKFGISQFIRLNAEVTSLNQTGHKRHLQANNHTEEFDGVIIASGFFSKPIMPKFSTDDNFNNKIIHSAHAQPHLHNPNERVVVYGGSFSGYELATEFAKVSKYPVTHLFQRPSWVVRRYVPQPTGREIPVDFSFYSRKSSEQKSSLSIQERTRLSIEFFKSAFGNPAEYHPDLAVSEDPNHPLFVVISEQYLDLVADGKIIPHRDNPETLSRYDGDLYVAATGYTARLPYLTEAEKSLMHYNESDQFMPAILHKSVWPKGIDDMAFVGFYRGPFFGIMELQARWVAGVLSGHLPKPTTEELEKGVTEALNLRNARPRPQFPYGNYVGLGDDLAHLVGCYPDLDVTDPLYDEVFEGTFLPSHFRLKGYGSNRGIAEEVMRRLPY